MSALQNILFVAPILLFSMVAHEYAHGWAALRQGDDTAQSLGRLTWNPIPHIDLFMTILLPLMLLLGSGGQMALGGAKPVPVDPSKYRHYRRGDIIVSLAGIVTNVLLAGACVPLVAGLGALGSAVPALAPSLAILQAMFVYGIYVNLVLAAFNLIPIPPLDGSHVVKHLLPRRWSIQYQRFGRYGIVLLVAGLWFGGKILGAWLAPALHVGELLQTRLDPMLLAPAREWLR